MDSMSGLSPSKQSHVLTSRKIKALAAQYSKVVDNIQGVGGMDQLKEEIDTYVVDEEIDDIGKDEGFEQYWTHVGNLHEGAGGWERYSVLPRFALAMGVKYNDTSDVESSDSFMNNIHQDKQRNVMSQDMLDSHLQIRYGVESKENRDKCETCGQSAPVPPHCHCTLAEVTDRMREKCRRAHVRCKAAQVEASEAKLDASKEEILLLLFKIDATRVSSCRKEES